MNYSKVDQFLEQLIILLDYTILQNEVLVLCIFLVSTFVLVLACTVLHGNGKPRARSRWMKRLSVKDITPQAKPKPPDVVGWKSFS